MKLSSYCSALMAGDCQTMIHDVIALMGTGDLEQPNSV